MHSGSAIPRAQSDMSNAQRHEASAPPMPEARPAHMEEVSFDDHDVVLYSFKVTRIHVDSPYIVLYAGALGIVYKIMDYPGNTYPQETMVHAWGNKKSPRITLLDKWGKSYHIIQEETLGQYTFQGKPIFFKGGQTPMPFVRPVN